MTDIAGNNPLGMKSIFEVTAQGKAEEYKKRIFKMDWVFCEWYEKLFLILLVAWTVYSIWRIIL